VGTEGKAPHLHDLRSRRRGMASLTPRSAPLHVEKRHLATHWR